MPSPTSLSHERAASAAGEQRHIQGACDGHGAEAGAGSGRGQCCPNRRDGGPGGYEPPPPPSRYHMSCTPTNTPLIHHGVLCMGGTPPCQLGCALCTVSCPHLPPSPVLVSCAFTCHASPCHLSRVFPQRSLGSPCPRVPHLPPHSRAAWLLAMTTCHPAPPRRPPSAAEVVAHAIGKGGNPTEWWLSAPNVLPLPLLPPSPPPSHAHSTPIHSPALVLCRFCSSDSSLPSHRPPPPSPTLAPVTVDCV
jgi:hypothetical protein